MRPYLDIDRFRSAAFTPKAVSECDVACSVLNVSLREGTLWVFCYQASVGGSGDFYNTLFPAAWFPARAFGHPRVSMVFFFSCARYDDLGDGCIF